MVDSGLLDDSLIESAYSLIESASHRAINDARRLIDIGVHHSIANRYIAPYLPCAHIMTGLSIWWEDFFAQRIKPDAERNIHALALATKDAISEHRDNSESDCPIHVPFCNKELLRTNTSAAIFSSVAKCARVSYANYKAEKLPEKELEFVRKLWQSKHVSPFEHVCFPRYWFTKEHCNLAEKSPFGNDFVSLRHLVNSPTELGRKYAALLN